MIRRRIVLVMLLVSLFALGWLAGRTSAGGPGDLYRNLDVFVEVLQRVQQSYVDVVPSEKLLDGAVRGLLRQLDPYSQYLDPKGYQDLQSTTTGTFGGVGLIVGIRERVPVVISPVEGGPAWSLGLRTGDILMSIDGKSTQGLALDEVAERLRGKPGTKVAVKVGREGDPDVRDVTIERQVITTRSVPYAFVLPNDVGYLRLADFSQDAGREVREGIESLRARGARRLVLDLRSNPGGLLDQAVDVSERFLPKGALVVSTRGRMKGQDQRFFSAEERPELAWPMVVLIDRGSASASEIVAGALQDLDRALVVGETSFGKGSVQSLFPLRAGGAIKLTTGRYYTPSGRSIHNLTHDRMLAALEDEDSEGDDAVAESLATAPVPEDTGKVATFHTRSGRTVRGGGGIRPDVVVPADSLLPVMRAVELRGLAFRVANRWITTHPGWTIERPVDDALRAELRVALDSAKVEVTPAQIEAERPLIDRALKRELARRLGGDAAAARVALDGDPVMARALAVLGTARAPKDVFALATRAPQGGTPAAIPVRKVARARQPAGTRR